MKTPRQILFEHHRAAVPKLDQIRKEALPRPNEPFLHKLWMKLVWPCPRAWAGLAAVWVAILFFNLSGAPTAPTTAVGGMAVRSFVEQRRELGEIMQAFAPPPSPALPPGKRSDRLSEMFVS